MKSKPFNFLLTGSLAAMLLMTSACGDSPQPTPINDLPSGTLQPARTTQTNSPSLGLVGELDPTFGNGGTVTTEFDSSLDQIRDMVVQPDGNIVVVGEAWPQQTPKFSLARYKPNGDLDPTFGDGGKVVTAVLDEGYDRGEAHAMLLQPDGKIVVAGGSHGPDYGHGIFAVLRYNPDGTLDETFGDDGKVQTALYTEGYSSSADEIHGIALQPDGKIVAAGTTGPFPPDIGLVRYNADGSLDETFGDDGIVITDYKEQDNAAHAVAVQSDGKILVAGYASTGFGIEFYDYSLLRYNEDGTLDETFGEGGMITTEMGNDQQDEARAIVLQPDGKITLAGPSVVGAQYCQASVCARNGFGLAQYNPDGSLDTTFGTGGITTRDYTVSAGNYDLVRLPNGNLATGGYISQSDFMLTLLTPNGKDLLSFGDKGTVRTKFGDYGDDAYAIALQSDGKILLGGSATVDPDDILNGDFALARYR